MRLIDADKLLPKLWVCYEENKPIVDAEPTVDAIPVEYIKNKIAANMHLWEEGLDKMFIENGVVEIVSYSLTAQTLSKLLELWEKENEGVSE